MDNKHMKRCLPSRMIRETQIKTSVKYHLVPVRKAITKKTRNNKYGKGCGEKRILVHHRWVVNSFSHYRIQYKGSSKN